MLFLIISYGVIAARFTTTEDKRIAHISSFTEANRSVVAAFILSGFTIRIHSARIRFAQVIYTKVTFI